MPRYFLELSYMGTRYSGFQVQENANTVQAEVEKALSVLLREKISCTGSSRTDAGVHAHRNYFHFDCSGLIADGMVYHLNALLPADIAANRLIPVRDDAHCRFHAISRSYRYEIYARKDPFLNGRAWFYPYPLDENLLTQSAQIILETNDFTSFAKRRSDAKTHLCKLTQSQWTQTDIGWRYEVTGNRFLRGMVRGLVSTMVLVGRGRIALRDLQMIIDARQNSRANFTAPGHGLYLEKVTYPDGYFDDSHLF